MELAGIALSKHQLRLLNVAFANGAEDASRSLSKWLRRGIRLTVHSVEQMSLSQATQILGPADELVTSCTVGLQGPLSGKMVLACGDEAGRAIVDFLLDLPLGSTQTWGNVEQSALMETANILICAYVTSLRGHLPDQPGASLVLPSPPQFAQDYAGSLLQSLLIEQAMQGDLALVINTRFERDETALAWQLLMVPEQESLAKLVAHLDRDGELMHAST